MAETKAAAEDVEGAIPEDSIKSEVAQTIVNRHAAYAAAGGLIPLPLVEIVATGTVQLRMISKLCDLYGLPFSQQVVKAAIAALAGSVLPAGALGRTTFSLFRAVPLVGPLLGMVTLPVLSAAMTWAIGRVFAWHFANGGTLENFDVSAKKEQFKREFAEGKRRAAAFVKGNGSSGEATSAAG